MDADPIVSGLEQVTKRWAAQRRAEKRGRSRRTRDHLWLSKAITLKSLCIDAMTDAYMKASGNGQLPTHWRQVFYNVRAAIKDEADRELADTYFKTIIDEYADPAWDIVRGARGTFKEPHDADGSRAFPMSTLHVRNYLNQGKPSFDVAAIPALIGGRGWLDRYGGVLICEKEGFDELLQADGLPERWDLALMSTKGISALAARDLAATLRAWGVRLFVLHDLDKNGFVMAAPFTRAGAIDLGLRMGDIEKWNLETDYQDHSNKSATFKNLKKNGATDEEAEYITGGNRVELNAFDGPDFVKFIESGLKEARLEKALPVDLLPDAWKRAIRVNKLNAELRKLVEADAETAYMPPPDLEGRIRTMLKENPALAWDDALAQIAEDDS
jgi:hypothetical protein